MEDLRSSRRPTKPYYGDVIGGPTKYPATFAAKSDDYAEIFGGIASSCSIPFLDLTPSGESCGGDGSIDYSEIFGVPNGGNFAVDYEELFGGRKKTAESSASSNGSEEFKDDKKTMEKSTYLNGRVQIDAKFVQCNEVSDLLPEGASKDYGACSEKDKLSSSSNHSDDGPKQFSMLYHGTIHGSIEDVTSGKTLITQLHAVPGYTYKINSCSSQDARSDSASNIQTKNLTHNVSYNARFNDVEQEKIAPPISFADNTKSYGADLRTNHKEYRANHAASEDDPVNVKHHNCSSSNYSASSGDIPYSDIIYASISEINLQTRPSRVPPPSRAPPKLVGKQENTKSHQIHYRIGTSKSHRLQGVAKGSSSCFLDVGVDACSAAAASAAAMKEAMEQAQARLKSAKEVMERKRDNLQSRKKLGPKEGAKYDERKEVKDSQEEKNFSEVTVKKPLSKEDKGMKDFALNDMQKVIKVGKAALNHEEKEIYVVTAEQSQQMRPRNGSGSSQMCYKSEEVLGERKTEEKFYDLINNDMEFAAVREASRQEDVEKKPKTTTKVSEDEENYSERAELSNEFKRTEDLHKVNETIERDEIDDNSEACNVTRKEEIEKKLEKIPETCILKENIPEDLPSSDQQNGNKKLQAAQEALASGEELKKTDAGEEASSGGNKLNVENSKNAFKVEEIYHDDEENGKLHAAEEVCEHVDKEDLRGTYVISASHESDEKLKMYRRTGVLQENENEMEVTSETCVNEAEEEVVALEGADQDVISEYTRANGKDESCDEENECKLEGSSSDSEHDESAKLNGTQGACVPVENYFRYKVQQNGNEVMENSGELKPVRVTEQKMNSAKVTCWQDYSGTETREAQLKLQQNEKKQDADHASSMVENAINPEASRGYLTESENGKFKEGNGALSSEESQETQNQFDSAQEVFQSAANKDIGDVQQGSRAENEDLGDAAREVCQKSQSSSPDPTEALQTLVTGNSDPDLRKREKLESEKATEREKEQARKLEEEKEREREREKDRLAVERATHEAHEQALAEARERAERIAVERVTAEARQRALAEAREKAEKASAEALEKSLAEKALKEAKLRAERAAVERATAEARERAVEKALAEKHAADARQRTERLSTTSRSRRDNEAGDCIKASDKEDREIKLKTSYDIPHDARFQNAGSSGSSQRYADSFAHGEVESPLRCKARVERHQRTVERAAKALAEKNLRDILAQREQAERNRLAESLDADVRRWSTGKEGNLRALLSTLQYILGPESGWQAIPLTDVITAAAVKKAYRKATLCVHPDKLQQRGASIQQKYICEKVFDLLKDAWNRFNSEER